MKSEAHMRLAVTGFVSEQSGSVASANALLLRALLESGLEVDFFSKPSFVNPRPALGARDNFRFVPVVNSWSDDFRRRVENIPVLNALARRNDAACYNRSLGARIRAEHTRRAYDAALWMGDYAHGSVPGIPTISFVQGPPGTDARSLLSRRQEIQRVAGKGFAWKWEMLARLRLSSCGLPGFHHSDHFIVGSSMSKKLLAETYSLPREGISTLPYPIDLNLFRPPTSDFRLPTSNGLRVLWLGRIVPRKRLDLFLDGAALAIARGVDVTLTIVGSVGFVPGYDRLIREFPFPDRLRWEQTVPRQEVPGLMHEQDILAQPSDEENFGSAVAEAQACGLPVIVGATNGNADYLSARDIRLSDDHPETFAVALSEMALRKQQGRWGDIQESRRLAERQFDLTVVAHQLMESIRQITKPHIQPACASA